MKEWLKKLNVKYLYTVGILTVSGLVLINLVVNERMIHEMKDDGRVINYAGKQRMLSQRIALYTYEVSEDFSKIDHLYALNLELVSIHKKLQQGDEGLRIPPTQSEEILTQLEELNPLVQELNQLVRSISDPEDLANNSPRIREVTAAFLPQMDDIVNLYEAELEAYIQNMLLIIFLIGMVIVGIIMLEARLVFKPITEEIILKSRKLKRALLSKDRILATVVHDLRNPINGIKGLNLMLKDDLKDEVNDDQELMFELIDDSTDKANNLIEELLDMSVLESDEFQLDTRVTLLGEYLMGNLQHFKKRAEEKGVHLNIETRGSDIKVNIDPKRFARVIDNLLSNALKFTDANGEINIKLMEEEGKGIIQISDNGIGIPEKLQPYIFDKFSKARRLGLSGEQTTGLGMSIVKQIVDLHKGSIWLESEEKKGTKFFISLPDAEAVGA